MVRYFRIRKAAPSDCLGRVITFLEGSPLQWYIWTEERYPFSDWSDFKFQITNVISDGAFWGSLRGGIFRRISDGEAEWGRIFAVLQAIWLHSNEVIFKGGWMVLVDGEEHDV